MANFEKVLKVGHYSIYFNHGCIYPRLGISPFGWVSHLSVSYGDLITCHLFVRCKVMLIKTINTASFADRFVGFVKRAIINLKTY